MHNNDDTPTQECALTLPSPPAGETARARGPSLADVCGELPRRDMASGLRSIQGSQGSSDVSCPLRARLLNML